MRALPLERSLAGVVVDTGSLGRRRGHRHRPAGPRRVPGLRLAQPRTRGGGAAAVRRAGGRCPGPGVEPGAGRGVLHPGPGAAGRLRRARDPGPADRPGPRGPSAPGDAGGPRPDRPRAARRGHPAAVRGRAGVAGDLPAGGPTRRRQPARPGRRRPGRDHQGHPPVDLRPGQHRRLARHPGRGDAAGRPGGRHPEVPAHAPVRGTRADPRQRRPRPRRARRARGGAVERQQARGRARSVEVLLSAGERRRAAGSPTTAAALDESVPESGLRNMRERAERRGGTFVVESARGEGTVLTWTVPAS